MVVRWLLHGLMDWIFCHIPFEYWFGNTIDILISVNVIYVYSTVSGQIVGYVRLEIGKTWSSHMLLKFIDFSDPSISCWFFCYLLLHLTRNSVL